MSKSKKNMQAGTEFVIMIDIWGIEKIREDLVQKFQYQSPEGYLIYDKKSDQIMIEMQFMMTFSSLR